MHRVDDQIRAKMFRMLQRDVPAQENISVSVWPQPVSTVQSGAGRTGKIQERSF